MDHTIRVFFGRTFSSEDIELIRWTKNKYPKLSRVELAKTLCEFWDWTTPAGLPKRVQCVAFLEKLEEEGLIWARLKGVEERIAKRNMHCPRKQYSCIRSRKISKRC